MFQNINMVKIDAWEKVPRTFVLSDKEEAIVWSNNSCSIVSKLKDMIRCLSIVWIWFWVLCLFTGCLIKLIVINRQVKFILSPNTKWTASKRFFVIICLSLWYRCCYCYYWHKKKKKRKWREWRRRWSSHFSLFFFSLFVSVYLSLWSASCSFWYWKCAVMWFALWSSWQENLQNQFGFVSEVCKTKKKH